MFRTKTVKSYPKKMKHLRTSLSWFDLNIRAKPSMLEAQFITLKIVYKLIETDADVTGEYSYQFSKDANETLEAVWT